MKILDPIALSIGLAGIAIIVYGALVAFASFLRLEWDRLRGGDFLRRSEDLRHHFGTYLLLGLEFLLAADIIHTLARPDLQGLLILGGIVAIRTVISYFLDRELRGAHRGSGAAPPSCRPCEGLPHEKGPA